MQTENEKIQELLKPRRHKWKKKIDHPYCRIYFCEKCGAKKDNTAINNTIYWVGEEKYYKAPPCATTSDYLSFISKTEKP